MSRGLMRHSDGSLQAFLRRKRLLRRALARLPIEDKIACLVDLQKMIHAVRKDYPVWNIGEDVAGRGLPARASSRQ